MASQYPWYIANTNPDPPVSKKREKLTFLREEERDIGGSGERQEVYTKQDKNNESTIARLGVKGRNLGNGSSYDEALVIFFAVPILVLFT